MRVIDLYEFIDADQVLSIFDSKGNFINDGKMSALPINLIQFEIKTIEVDPEMDNCLKISLQA